MTLFDRYPVIARPLFGLLTAVLAAAALITFVNYAGAPTDENIFANIPRMMTLYVTVPIVCRGGDTIRVGDLVDRINGVQVADSAALASALRSVPADSVIRIVSYRPSALSFSDHVARAADIPPSFALFIHDFIAVTDVTSGGASDRAGLKVGDLLFSI
ncbi:MAG TPA: hypothetical protein VMF59_10920, partial [Bacteroidota bacterium]|nr:hypothetical protein [Bacteroidota bacterium]